MPFKKLEKAEDAIVLGSQVAEFNRPVTVNEILERLDALRSECDRAFERFEKGLGTDNEFWAAIENYTNYLEKQYVSK